MEPGASPSELGARGPDLGADPSELGANRVAIGASDVEAGAGDVEVGAAGSAEQQGRPPGLRFAQQLRPEQSEDPQDQHPTH